MRQHEQVPEQYTAQVDALAGPGSLSLESIDSSTSTQFTFEPIKENMFRVTFTSPDHPIPPHPSVFRPQVSVAGVVCNTSSAKKHHEVTCGSVTASVDWTGSPLLSISLDGEEVHRDLEHRSYVLDATGVAHYTYYKRDTLHVGLGEKAAPMNLSNRFFQIAATDSFGYDVYRTDPLYKHIPLLINVTPEGCVAIFSTSHSRATWAVGSEIEGLWGHFKVYRQDYGGLEEFLIVGRTVKDVVRSYAELAGFPQLLPRWALGYLGGGMKYGMTDEPRGCDLHLEFVENCKKHDIPCSAFQMSSGYTIAEEEPKTRNVFTWNRVRFPDPRDFTKKMHASGVRLVANVKPYILSNHPSYKTLKGARSLFTDPLTEKSAVARLWSAGGGESGVGGHVDFTSEAGFRWWCKGVEDLRKVGIDGIWNDNNEISIPDDDWELSLQNEAVPAGLKDKRVALWGRALQTELMAKASYEGLKQVEPEVRPFILTRSATAGTMRYAASSWSGDNVTSWDGMKGSNALSLNAGMSLLQSYGHDIGGFEGPQPTPELLLRWVQMGIYSPRFAINCFKTTPDNNLVGEVIEPWMYPEITPLIRKAIQRRYEIIPYLYSLALDSHMTATPPMRWIGWGYESDEEVWKPSLLRGETQYWLGDSLLIGGVFEPGASSARMYLPTLKSRQKADIKKNAAKVNAAEMEGYININAPYQHFQAGQWINIESKWKDSIPIFARIGGAVLVGKPVPTACPLPIESREEFPSLVPDDYRGVEIFPPKGSSGSKEWANTWYEDDGLSRTEDAQISTFVITYGTTKDEIVVSFLAKETNKFVPVWTELIIILPVGETRPVRSKDESARIVDIGEDMTGRRRFQLKA